MVAPTLQPPLAAYRIKVVLHECYLADQNETGGRKPLEYRCSVLES